MTLTMEQLQHGWLYQFVRYVVRLLSFLPSMLLQGGQDASKGADSRIRCYG